MNTCVVWDGIIRRKTLTGKELNLRLRLADYATCGDWHRMLSMLREEPAMVNVTRPDGSARQREHTHLLTVLKPPRRRVVPGNTLSAIQLHFHSVIRGRATCLVQQHSLRLPELEPLLEYDEVEFWFAVPGMYGGFKYHLNAEGAHSRLISHSWSRVVDASGQRHEITSAGNSLVEEGFM